MAHIFYTSMIEAGATEKEATEAMKAYVFSFYHEQIEDAPVSVSDGSLGAKI